MDKRSLRRVRYLIFHFFLRSDFLAISFEKLFVKNEKNVYFLNFYIVYFGTQSKFRNCYILSHVIILAFNIRVQPNPLKFKIPKVHDWKHYFAKYSQRKEVSRLDSLDKWPQRSLISQSGGGSIVCDRALDYFWQFSCIAQLSVPQGVSGIFWVIAQT